ncbi:transposase family protein [Nonomuraea africana]|uniref:transposase family protein n=1 Tax=Nonomuraea africana TaxID=46171 RepID=UPI003B5BA1D3
MAAKASCPECGLPSARVHSRYRRTVWDLATCGRPVKVELEVRRFSAASPPVIGRSSPSRSMG